MALLGKGNEAMRLPMVPVTRATRHKLELLVGELGLMVEAPPSTDNLRMF
jgi:4-hydroxy-tetrahydrodipicolinate synthase